MIFVSDFYQLFGGKVEIVECFPLIVFKGYAIKKATYLKNNIQQKKLRCQ